MNERDYITDEKTPGILHCTDCTTGEDIFSRIFSKVTPWKEQIKCFYFSVEQYISDAFEQTFFQLILPP